MSIKAERQALREQLRDQNLGFALKYVNDRIEDLGKGGLTEDQKKFIKANEKSEDPAIKKRVDALKKRQQQLELNTTTPNQKELNALQRIRTDLVAVNANEEDVTPSLVRDRARLCYIFADYMRPAYDYVSGLAGQTNHNVETMWNRGTNRLEWLPGTDKSKK